MLEQSLSQLTNAQLIHELSAEEATYLFKHTLTQEAAYDSLLLKRRRELHARVARALEQLYPAQLDENAALLALHYQEAGDMVKTLEYSRRAGDVAARRNANPAAIAYYTRAIELVHALTPLQSGGADTNSETLIALYRRRGRALEVTGQYDQAAANYVEMEAEGERRGDAAFRLAALVERAKLLSTPNPKWDWERGMPLAEQALDLARELGDREAQARLLWILLLSNYYGRTDLDRAEQYGLESLALARQFSLREQMAYALTDLGGVYLERGEPHRALTVLTEAESLWRELDNGPMLTDALANLAVAHFYLGEFKVHLRFADEGYQIGQTIGNEWGQANCHMLAGQSYMELGQWGRAIETLQDTIRLSDLSGHPGAPIITRAILALALGRLGDVQNGMQIAKVALERSDFMLPFRPWPLAVLALLSLLANDPDAAEAYLQEASSTLLLFGSLLAPAFVMLAQAELALARKDYPAVIATADRLLEHLRRTETRVFQYDALYLKAQALGAGGQLDAAYQVILQAETQAESIGARGSLWAILITRGDFESQRGQPQAAATSRARARAIVQDLADSVHQPELRNLFRQLPEIRAALTPP